jgi:hypothetical protein
LYVKTKVLLLSFAMPIGTMLAQQEHTLGAVRLQYNYRQVDDQG